MIEIILIFNWMKALVREIAFLRLLVPYYTFYNKTHNINLLGETNSYTKYASKIILPIGFIQYKVMFIVHNSIKIGKKEFQFPWN